MKQKSRMLTGITALIGIAFAVAPALADTISYLPITNDSDSDISSSKTYTHAIDFGNNDASPGGVATINGVVFANGGIGSFPAVGGSSQTVGTGSSNIPSTHSGDTNANTSGGMLDLVTDMIHGFQGTAVITLTGLTPGQPYKFRLYHRQWGSTAGTARGQNIGFDTDGTGGTDISGAEDTGTFEEDDASQPDPSQAAFNQVYAYTYDYTLSPGVTTLTIYLEKLETGPYHLYGLTNELNGPDIVAPAVVGFSPADEATDVYLATDLVATFTEDIALTGVGSITVAEVGGDGSSDFSIDLSSLPDSDAAVSVAGAVLTIDPTDNLEPGQEYEVTISGGVIEDLADTPNAYGGTTSGQWTFTTAAPDATAPVIDTKVPADDSTDVAAFTNIVATFDEDLVLGSGNITLYNVTLGGAAATIDVTDSSQVTLVGNVLTINPTVALDGPTEYAVQMDAGVVRNLNDLPSAAITDTTTWSFTTEDPPIFVVNDGSFGGSPPGATVTQSISVGAGADMLIVMTSAELGGTGPMTVTYGGVAMNLAVGDLANSAIWYLDLATPGIIGTDVVVDMSGYSVRNGFAAGWVSINGTLGAGETIAVHSTGTSAAQSNTVDLTTTVQTFNGVNFNGNNKAGTVTVNSPNPTVIYTDNDIGSARGAAAYTAEVAAGSHTYQWTLSGVAPPHVDYRRIDAAAFAVVLDPGGDTYTDWIGGYPDVGDQTGLDDDPDGDGNDNGVENYFGTDPSAFSQGLVAGSVDTGAKTFTFTHPLNATPASDLTATYRWSTDLASFYDDGSPDGAGTTTVTFAQGAPSGGEVTVIATISGSVTPDKLFVAIEVTQNP